MAERTHADDFNDLIDAATDALEQALADGERKGLKPGTWLEEEDFGGHLAHARAHLAELQIPDGAFWVHDEDLSHAICRLIMAWAMRNAVAEKHASDQPLPSGLNGITAGGPSAGDPRIGDVNLERQVRARLPLLACAPP